MVRFFYSLSILLTGAFPHFLPGQPCDQLDLRLRSEIPSTCFQMTLTMKMDRLGRPYLYVAGKEGGLRIYELSSPAKPQLVLTIPVSEWKGLHVMNLFQKDRQLFLALGNHFGATGQAPGIAVIDVADPGAAKVTDTWAFSIQQGGAGVVAAEGDFAYLGAMEHGLMTFRVSSGGKLEFLSQFVPDIRFPDANPDPAKYNARGMTVKGNAVYLCYDAGGIRTIDVSDRSKPRETARFANPALNGLPRAYNNAVLDGNLLYVAVDYCGLEIWDVADPAKAKLLSWWNPWSCGESPLKWFSSPGHTNELALDENCKLLFLATGKSDLHVLDVSEPASPDSCGFYGGTENGIGTWGLDIFQGKLLLSYVCAAIPFSSNWTGVKVLTYNNRCSTAREEADPGRFSLFPNPASVDLTLTAPGTGERSLSFEVYDLLGRRFPLKNLMKPGGDLSIDVSGLPSGLYLLQMRSGSRIRTAKFQIMR